MKLLCIIVLFALSVIVEGTLLAAARSLFQPVLLSFGAVFTAIMSEKYDQSKSGHYEWDENREEYVKTGPFQEDHNKAREAMFEEHRRVAASKTDEDYEREE